MTQPWLYFKPVRPPFPWIVGALEEGSEKSVIIPSLLFKSFTTIFQAYQPFDPKDNWYIRGG